MVPLWYQNPDSWASVDYDHLGSVSGMLAAFSVPAHLASSVLSILRCGAFAYGSLKTWKTCCLDEDPSQSVHTPVSISPPPKVYRCVNTLTSPGRYSAIARKTLGPSVRN